MHRLGRQAGWRAVTVTFERLEHAKHALLGLGPEVEVLEPLELREAIIAAVGSLAQLYLARGRRLESEAGSEAAARQLSRGCHEPSYP